MSKSDVISTAWLKKAIIVGTIGGIFGLIANFIPQMFANVNDKLPEHVQSDEEDRASRQALVLEFIKAGIPL